MIRESNARQDGVVDTVLDPRTAIRVSDAIPHGAGCARRRVLHGRIERGFIPFDLTPTGLNLITQSKIQGQVRPHLVVVLDKDLWKLQPAAIFRRLICTPALRLSQQEVGVGRTGGTVALSRLSVRTRIAHRAGIQVAPGRRVVLEDQELATEVQNMLSFHKGNHIGRVVNVFFIYRIGLRAEYRAAVAPLVVAVDLDVREVIGFGKLPSQLAWVSLAER